MPDMSDELIIGHAYQGGRAKGGMYVTGVEDPHSGQYQRCGYPSNLHANPGPVGNFVQEHPHSYLEPDFLGDHCAMHIRVGEGERVCGYPASEHPTRGGLAWDKAGEEPEDVGHITGHPYTVGQIVNCNYVPAGEDVMCGQPRIMHADQGLALTDVITHAFSPSLKDRVICGFSVENIRKGVTERLICGEPPSAHLPKKDPYRFPVRAQTRQEDKPKTRAVVRMADAAQYAREPMPDAARAGITVTLLDAPTDPLGTLAAICGIYEGKVFRSKTEVTDEHRREALEAMQATVLNGPLEAVQFTFLIEGVSRAIANQMTRNRFSFFAQESLRFAVAEDWAAEVPLPPSLAGQRDEDPAVMMWRRALNHAEDSYAALVGAGMPAEEARGVLPLDITTRLHWVVSLRTLLTEAGKRTCTQAQFPWRVLFGGVAKAFRERGRQDPYWGSQSYFVGTREGEWSEDGWQYRAFADLLRPVCYQQGKCGFMAKFDRGCTIRSRVDANEKLGRPSSEWHTDSYPVGNPGHKYDDKGREIARAIDPAEWAADPAAARVTEEEK